MSAVAHIPELTTFLDEHRHLFVLTGAGISTGSGIPAYRDENGDWKRPAPVQFRDFLRHHRVRQRYWARSLIGWPWFAQARPNLCHRTLASWEYTGRVETLVTQNVDRLHQAAGAKAVIDLHGRLDRIRCLDCNALISRGPFQDVLRARNPTFAELTAAIGPDGDAYIDDIPFEEVEVPTCEACGGMLKPDVVFFGETIPKPTLKAAIDAVNRADAVLVIGSSLMVYSGFRFCRIAAERQIPIVAISPGRTRADELLALKISAPFETVIDALPKSIVNHDRPDSRRLTSP